MGCMRPNPAQDFLWRVRYPNLCQRPLSFTASSKKLGTFTIWIDAICIDQKDDRDKERQIPLMGDIYSRATTVYIWLGEGSPDTDTAMGYISTVGFLNYFYENGDPDEEELPTPLFWAAIWSYFCSRWSLRRSYVPHRRTTNLLAWSVPCLRRYRMRYRYGNASKHQIRSLLDSRWVKRI